MILRRNPAAWLAAIALGGCAFLAPPADPDADVLVVGDSIPAWHRASGDSIADVIAEETGLTVSNVAVGGARFLGRAGIPDQYLSSDWDWVILDGGGNDLLPDCGTPDAARVLDAIVTQDGRGGAMADFVDRVAANGAGIVILGYYDVSTLGGPFAPCAGNLDDLNRRQAALAASRDGVFHVDTGAVIDPADPGAYDPDLVHPSPRGAEQIARQIIALVPGLP